MAQVAHPPGSLHGENIAEQLAHPPGMLRVVVVSPSRPLYEDTARWVTVRAWDGQLGIWPRHADMVAALGVGLLRVGHPNGSVERWAIWGGFLKVTGPKVTILVDRAVAAGEVDAAAARRELDETKAALRKPESDEQFEHLLDQRRFHEAKVRLTS